MVVSVVVVAWCVSRAKTIQTENGHNKNQTGITIKALSFLKMD